MLRGDDVSEITDGTVIVCSCHTTLPPCTWESVEPHRSPQVIVVWSQVLKWNSPGFVARDNRLERVVLSEQILWNSQIYASVGIHGKNLAHNFQYLMIGDSGDLRNQYAEISQSDPPIFGLFNRHDSRRNLTVSFRAHEYQHDQLKILFNTCGRFFTIRQLSIMYMWITTMETKMRDGMTVPT